MAGDWIKIRTNLHEDPRVIQLADQLGVPELHVVGMLWRLWGWADQHTENAKRMSVTDVTIDKLVCNAGFTNALKNVGWLVESEGRFSLPGFEEHNGKTAKKRIQVAERVARHRAKTGKSGAQRVSSAKPPKTVTQKRYKGVTEALPEKRREESNTSVLQGGTIPQGLSGPEFLKAWDEWFAYRRERKLPVWRAATIKKQLAALDEMGAPAAVEAINQSIANGWNGLFAPKNNGTNQNGSSNQSRRGFESKNDYSKVGVVS